MTELQLKILKHLKKGPDSMSNIGYAVVAFKKMEADRIRPQGAAFAVGKHVRKLQELG